MCVHDSFVRLGGDSITAMQISAASRAQKLAISTADILREKTIAALAEKLEADHAAHESIAADKGIDNLPSGLSPVQRLLHSFPLAFASHDDIDDAKLTYLAALRNFTLDDIEDIFPCTGMQEGMLIAQNKAVDEYHNVFQYDISSGPEPDSVIDMARIEQAWCDVVGRHALLRAIIIDTIPGSSRTMQIILKDVRSSISHHDRSEWSEQSGLGVGPTYDRYGPQHHLSIIKIDDRLVRIQLKINHAIMDGHSHGILISDFWQLYNGISPSQQPGSYRDFVKYLEDRPQDLDWKFWTAYLDGVQPCLFPASRAASQGRLPPCSVTVLGLDSSAIHRFCSEREITIASIVHTAWALVLMHWTGNTTPCFGSIVSGRHIAVPSVDSIFGPLISVIPFCARLGHEMPAIEVLRQMQDHFAESLPHQTISPMMMNEHLRVESSPRQTLSPTVIDEHSRVESSGLFNTTISFTRSFNEMIPYAHGLTLRADQSSGKSEVGAVLNN
jgi:aryl carrier-like protein